MQDTMQATLSISCLRRTRRAVTSDISMQTHSGSGSRKCSQHAVGDHCHMKTCTPALLHSHPPIGPKRTLPIKPDGRAATSPQAYSQMFSAKLREATSVSWKWNADHAATTSADSCLE